MAIPIGTTQRQLAALARWTLAALVALGLVALWWPNYRTWGVLGVGLLAVFALWMLWKLLMDDARVPRHPLHWALLGPGAILAAHWLISGVAPRGAARAVAGAMELSVLFQLGLLALGVLLTQTLLPRAASHAWVLTACGGAAMIGAGAGLLSGRIEEGGAALAMVGLAGIGVWLAPLWAPPDDPEVLPAVRRRGLRAIYFIVAAIAALALTIAAPSAALAAGYVLGLVLLIAGAVFRRGRGRALAAGGVLVALAAAATGLLRPALPELRHVAAGPLGLGERAFRSPDLMAGGNGLLILGAMVGWVGVLWLLGGMVLSVVWLMGHARHAGSDDLKRTVAWTAAAALATTALFMPGGLFIPAVTLAAALAWGLMPKMLCEHPRMVAPWGLLAALPAMGFMLLMSPGMGLAAWMVGGMGGDDATLHAAAGLIMALTLGWLGRLVHPAVGVVLILIAGATGGLAEWVQAVASQRSSELSDWAAHLAGCGLAGVLYLLAIGSRWCESAEARPLSYYQR